MYRCFYDRLLAETEKNTKEELFQEIMSLNSIECADRTFANECESGTAIYNINKLFSALNDMKVSFAGDKLATVYDLIESAEKSWYFIKEGLANMNDASRTSKQLNDLKERVSKAKDAYDSI